MHLAVDAGTTDVEPEGDETILSQDKPIGTLLLSPLFMVFMVLNCRLCNVNCIQCCAEYCCLCCNIYCYCRIHNVWMLESTAQLWPVHGIPALLPDGAWHRGPRHAGRGSPAGHRSSRSAVSCFWVVVYHVTIVANGLRWLKKLGPMQYYATIYGRVFFLEGQTCSGSTLPRSVTLLLPSK